MAGEPSRRSRSRSRSPGRRTRHSRGGFRWKDNRRRDEGRDDSGQRRDFRDRSRERERERDGYQRRGRDGDGGRDRYRDGATRNRDAGRDRDGASRGSDRLRSPRRDSRDSRVKHDARKENKNKSRSTDAAAAAAPAAPAAGAGEEMIIVNVNDRLGSKSAVPCLPSDTVGQFKIMVAARIGREPSQIMLKRQGERPFKDHITLEDYGISNGVQLDLEIDTGD
ncbi:hypothetical protein E4U54_004416 [Claviceps lovelessii]|nr:hypothetical protein E4U54_004416 [Claviceps lovelessii]